MSYAAPNVVVADKSGAMQIYVGKDQPMPLHKAVAYLAKDIEMISGQRAEIVNSVDQIKKGAIIVGLSNEKVVKSAVDKGLVPNNKLLSGKRECYVIKSVKGLFGDKESSIVISGSDPLGAAFGVFELSKMMGVSPLYWWCDTEPKRVETLALESLNVISKEPSVRYRGIFINDEEALVQWSSMNTPGGMYKGITPESYERVFELMLRLKANSLWPSMMEAGSYFFEVKDENGVAVNPRNATDYGIYVGTSHCENMARNNYDEWYNWAELNREKYNINDLLEFDYTVNPKAIEAYWMERLVESKDFNMIYTMGIRGVHDSPYQCRLLENPTLENRVKFLQNVINRQRQMIKEVFGSEDAVPQIFVPYEETGELYNGESKDGKEKCKGLELPTDIMIVVTEDNHGYLRQTPTPKELKRKGGNGFYYHLAYQGGPAPYDWLTTMPYALMREQLIKGYDAGSKDYWIVNVGDIKPAELGVSYFMAVANDIDAWRDHSPREFVAEQSEILFGVDEKRAKDITSLYTEFTQMAYAHRPDFMTSTHTIYIEAGADFSFYSPCDYGDEALLAIEKYKGLESRAKVLYDTLSEDRKAPFWHLVYYPIRSARLMSEKSYYYRRNSLYEEQGRFASVNKYQQLSDVAAAEIKADLHTYDTMLDGKWRGIMDPYGYYNLTERVYDIAGIPEYFLFKQVYEQQQVKALGSVCEGQRTGKESVKLRFSKGEDNRRFIDLFSRHNGAANWSVSSSSPWVKFSKEKGSVAIEERIWLSIDWAKAPKDLSEAVVKVTGEGNFSKSYTVVVENYDVKLKSKSYMEGCGYVVVEAENYSRNRKGKNGAEWVEYKDYGYVGSSMFVKNSNGKITKESNVAMAAALEYDIYFTTPGTHQGYIFRIPTLNEGQGRSAELAVALDSAKPTTLSGVRAKGARITQKLSNGNTDSRRWSQNVGCQMERIPFVVTVDKAGYHTLKIYQRDSDIGFDRIVIATDKANLTAMNRSVNGATIGYNSFGVEQQRAYSELPEVKGEVKVEKYPNPEPLLYTKFCFSKYGCPAVWGFNVVSSKNVFDPKVNQYGWSADTYQNAKPRHHESMRRVPHWKRDSNFGTKPATFCVKLVPGKYEMNLYAGDYYNEFVRKPGIDLTMSVKANGKVLMENMTIKGDHPHTGCYEVVVGMDCLLEVEFSGSPWAISALEFYHK